MTRHPFFLILFALATFPCVSPSNSLDFSLHSYGKLRSDEIRHEVVRKSASPIRHDHVRRIEAPIDNRLFVLELTPAKELFASDFKVVSVDGKGTRARHRIDPYRFYRGKVHNEKLTDVVAHVDDDNVVTATIWTKNETYHIEPASRHFSQAQSFHMITYKGSDVKFNFSGSLYCNATDETDARHNFVGLNLDIESDATSEAHLRRRRAVERDSCGIALVADYKFFEAFGRGDEGAAAQYLINIFVGVDKRFRDTDFGEGYTGVGFVLQQVIVHTEPSVTRESLNEAPYNERKSGIWDSRNYLNAIIASQQGWTKFCLVHVFTNQDFPGGLLGLAPIASPVNNKIGGICAPAFTRSRKLQYTNVGYSTGTNWEKKLVIVEQQIVLQHELGHNWGSPHDSQSCQSGNSKFIMSPSAVDGGDPKNFEFSTCSRASILSVLKSKSGCFIQKTSSFCGNQFREPGEECDAGSVIGSSTDRCCDENCRLKSGATCSDDNDDCCRNCAVANASIACFEAEPLDLLCRNTTYCNGTSASCPPAQSKANGSPCINEGECQRGQCNPFCKIKGYSPCICPDNECVVCCGSGDSCLPYDEIQTGESRRFYPNGTVCLRGICDNGVCEEEVQDTVPRFWDAIDDFSFNVIARWIRDNIVAAVLLFTTLLWIPASLIFRFYDKKREKSNEEKERRLNETDGPMTDEDEVDGAYEPDDFRRWARRGRSFDKVALLKYDRDLDLSW
ncbi:ADAM 17-like protease [Oscarella lobularis]|uniref:ADAM 17-like protease n=1 Tax=Oscarella lobularis TaxID=121494 RepID=UPI00331320B8